MHSAAFAVHSAGLYYNLTHNVSKELTERKNFN